MAEGFVELDNIVRAPHLGPTSQRMATWAAAIVVALMAGSPASPAAACLDDAASFVEDGPSPHAAPIVSTDDPGLPLFAATVHEEEPT